MWGLALGMWGQETDFSPYARFGLGTHQGLLSPGLASTVGLVSVTPDNVFLHADQPASAAGLANPTFQVSAHSQRMHLSEGERTSNAWTGGPGNMGLVVKKPRSNSALSLGLTPLTSKAFSVQRVAEDSLVGNLLERYEGTGGVARAHAGLSHGWRGKTWIQAGADSVLVTHRGLDLGAQVDHWFGDARQISTLDLEDASFRDVQTVTSFRHRAAGWILGAQGFQVLQAKYDENKQFKGSWVMRFGGTYSPARTLNTDYERLVQSTLPLGGVTTGIDTTSFEQSERSGTVPQKWTVGRRHPTRRRQRKSTRHLRGRARPRLVGSQRHVGAPDGRGGLLGRRTVQVAGGGLDPSQKTREGQPPDLPHGRQHLHVAFAHFHAIRGCPCGVGRMAGECRREQAPCPEAAARANCTLAWTLAVGTLNSKPFTLKPTSASMWASP